MPATVLLRDKPCAAPSLDAWYSSAHFAAVQTQLCSSSSLPRCDYIASRVISPLCSARSPPRSALQLPSSRAHVVTQCLLSFGRQYSRTRERACSALVPCASRTTSSRRDRCHLQDLCLSPTTGILFHFDMESTSNLSLRMTCTLPPSSRLPRR